MQSLTALALAFMVTFIATPAFAEFSTEVGFFAGNDCSNMTYGPFTLSAPTNCKTAYCISYNSSMIPYAIGLSDIGSLMPQQSKPLYTMTCTLFSGDNCDGDTKKIAGIYDNGDNTFGCTVLPKELQSKSISAFCQTMEPGSSSACSSPAAGHYPEPPPPPASTQETVTQNEFQIFGDPLCGNPLNESVPLPSMDDKNNCASSQCFPLTFDDNAPAAAIQLRQSQELSDFYCDVYPTMDCTESKTYYETQVAGIHKGDTIGCTPIPGPRLNMSVKCFCS